MDSEMKDWSKRPIKYLKSPPNEKVAGHDLNIPAQTQKFFATLSKTNKKG